MIKIIFNTYADGRKILSDQVFDTEEELNHYLENDADFKQASEEHLKNSCYEDSWLYYTEECS